MVDEAVDGEHEKVDVETDVAVDVVDATSDEVFDALDSQMEQGLVGHNFHLAK